ncbi:nuclease-related domain-containing protein [Neobacillus sp. SuZ13]|uniref:nuclease-related domain-containing protein n=1 Tax=Neobacillus sp. SuZ13 TaxID=3047875 RepID=UPI0024BFC7C6|nr:nuclease-related domain-containing protein [Neobacillus sp. SuZ13]WHY68060.1 nuclease-related domain-containing protein [Neobacillus sp. SuZ13]
MFVKDLAVPLNLLKAEALEKRMPPNHPKLIDLRLFIKNLRSGYSGEMKIRYYLGQIPSKRFYIFHDLRLPYGDGYFQIDALLISPRGILMIDGKNHSGKLTIEKNQMIQDYMDKRIVYDNPIAQAHRHNLLLKYFLEKHKIPPMPIDSLVVISKSSTELCISPGYAIAEKKICRVGELLGKIEVFYNQHNKTLLDPKNIEKIKRLLLKSHTPLITDIMQKFSLQMLEIITGVQCPNCFRFPMSYNRKIWVCPHCHFISQDAHLVAIRDYFLLIDSSFTNMEIRTFLHLPSTRITTYFLSSLCFPYTGTTKGRVYHQPQNFL